MTKEAYFKAYELDQKIKSATELYGVFNPFTVPDEFADLLYKPFKELGRQLIETYIKSLQTQFDEL